ncbi:MAG: alpha/beta hydrolase [Pseudomonadota bacterium]
MKSAILIVLALVSGHSAAMELRRGTFDYEGRTLSFFCAGSGEPTLVLEAPSGISNEEAFANVIEDLSAGHTVCAYERAFYGESEPLADGQIQSLQDYVDELAAFLDSQHQTQPIILVGYSYGGWVSRSYAANHPERVAGLVLIDSPHVQWMRQMKSKMDVEDWVKVEDIFEWFLANRGHDAWNSQFEMEATPDLPPNLPLAVITRTQDHERMRLSGISEAAFRIYNDVHFELAPDLLNLTERTIGFSATQSQHYIPESEPEIVLEAVQAVVTLTNTDHSDLK